MTSRPLIIIGAGRSGTNILRDCLTRIPGWETWDCDEINLVWRHGNRDHPNDLFTAEQATSGVARYIRRTFDRFQAKTGAELVIEKTCANSLRVPFIKSILPDARFVFLVRDGRDVALSAAARWTAPIELGYLARKVRYVPVMDIPHYGMRFVRNRLKQRQSDDRRQAVWGPVYPGMKEDAQSLPLLDVCAKQWAFCVDQAAEDLAALPKTDVFQLSYEGFVDQPLKVLHDLAQWVDRDKDRGPLDAAAATVRKPSKTWRDEASRLTPEALEMMQPTLERFGYETSS